jgi:hypothetical protein
VEEIYEDFQFMNLSSIIEGLVIPYLDGEHLDPFNYKFLLDTKMLYQKDIIDRITYVTTEKAKTLSFDF